MAADEDERRSVLMDLYRAFNLRDIDAVLVHLAPGVDWPNGWQGGREHGRDAVRDYWQRQWKEIDPRVEPLSIDFDADGKAHVRVQRLIRSLKGEVLDNRKVEHVYEFEGPFIKRMEIHPLAEAEDDDGV
jgi:hypothetical protein